MSTAIEARESLETSGFTVEDKRPERDYFIVTCKTCKARYSLGIKDGQVRGGNILFLLNHEGEHLHKGGQ